MAQIKPVWQPLGGKGAGAGAVRPAGGMTMAAKTGVAKPGVTFQPAKPAGAVSAAPKLGATTWKKPGETSVKPATTPATEASNGKVQKPYQKKTGGSWNSGGGSWGMMPWLLAQLSGMPTGKGKGKGGGWGSKSSTKPLPANTEVDETSRFVGTVSKYFKNSGYGWVDMKQKGVVPDDKVYVYHKALVSDDRFPFLKEGMDVEFNLEVYSLKREGSSKKFVRAKNVTAPGGQTIAIQDEFDAETKTFVGSQNLRYSGTIKFYSAKRRFGYIHMDEGYSLPEAVPQEIKVEHAEVNCGGKEVPKNMKGVPCEFGIYKTEKGEFRAYNVTMQGSMPFSVDALDNRQYVGQMEYKGTMEIKKWSQGHGFIKLDPTEVLPAYVLEKAKQQGADSARDKERQTDTDFIYFARDDLREQGFIKKGQAVAFKIYIDEKGLGAADIHAI